MPVASVSAAPPEVLPAPAPVETSPLSKAAISRARVDCMALHPVAEKWRVDHPAECPTVERLRAEKELSASSDVRDPWGNLYEIRCADDDTFVSSRGPDAQAGTADDIIIPYP